MVRSDKFKPRKTFDSRGFHGDRRLSLFSSRGQQTLSREFKITLTRLASFNVVKHKGFNIPQEQIYKLNVIKADNAVSLTHKKTLQTGKPPESPYVCVSSLTTNVFKSDCKLSSYFANK